MLAVAVSVLTRGPAEWSSAAFGVVAVLFGLTLVTDFRAGATAMPGHYKTGKPFGIDYSQSIYSNPLSARAFGAMAVVLGVGFIVGSLSAP